ncbi:right-handed parallel beta-helix repeat-containing protein [Kitasatospora sp. Root107]|uniref:right-handed parallel beta-helix repeat-containing protein n=1 Tax=Kitasatospora sp. Root107 TaxID=1736424 RepID=UPI0012FA227E|nr:right-handed parallel beta-helix repeat-containing protein [Kitasatospora sp. Root107]
MSSAVIGSSVPVLTAQAEAAVLHVDKLNASCSDAGTGTAAQPYCTIQAAADDVQPGQTVEIAATGYYTSYDEQVTVRSGTPGEPVTFRGVPARGEREVLIGTPWSMVDPRTVPHGFLIAGVHDVTVTGVLLSTPQEGVLVRDSQRIVLDSNTVEDAGEVPPVDGVPAFPADAPGIRLTGATADVTVSRNRVHSSGTVGIAVEAGAARTVVTTNQVVSSGTHGVLVTDAPGTVVTSNTVSQNCQAGIVLAGNSSGSTIKNNILNEDYTSCAVGPQFAELVVSAGSTAGTVADYNTVHPWTGKAAYSWGGTVQSPAEFKALGQGGHDNAVDPRLGFANGDQYAHTAVVGLTDAADESAPGQLSTDINGRPRANHPGIADTGTGTGYSDRGATEIQDPIGASVSGYAHAEPGYPLRAVVQGSYNPGWSSAGVTLDFGDGSAPIASPGLPVTHDYPAAGTYTVTLTATSTQGLVRKSTATLTISKVGSVVAGFSVGQQDRSVPTVSFTDQSSSPWPVSRYVINFGDGTPAVVSNGPTPPALTHTYEVGRTYTVSETVYDDHGRSASSSAQSYVVGPQPGTPVTGYFGGPTTQVGLFDNGRWAVSYQKVTAQASYNTSFGNPGDVPVVGRWEMGGAPAQLGVYRPSSATFALQLGNGSVVTVPFGEPGDIPVPGYWDNNGHHQLAIYRPSEALLAVRHDNGSVTTLRFGSPGDLPVVGDWDGVGHAQFGIFRPGAAAGAVNTFALRHDNGSVSTAAYGEKGDLPVVGDWSWKNRTTFGIYRPSSRTFALSNAYAQQADMVFKITN